MGPVVFKSAGICLQKWDELSSKSGASCLLKWSELSSKSGESCLGASLFGASCLGAVPDFSQQQGKHLLKNAQQI